MAPKKGQGNSKDKQPAKCRAPRASPPVVSSSSDEKGWPVWEELHAKIVALEQQRAGQANKESRDKQTLQLARQSKVHKQTKLIALADNLLSHFAALEAGVQGESGATEAPGE